MEAGISQEIEICDHEWVKIEHPYWSAIACQNSNKGPLVILRNSRNEEMCRVLVDTVTKTCKMLVDTGHGYVERKK